MSCKYIMGIDAGTSNIKVVLFDTKGKEVFSSSRRTVLKIEDNIYEQDMEILWWQICEGIRDIMQNNNINPLNIISIGITGQGEGCWLIDSKGKPVRNAILWCDGRASQIVDEINGIEEKRNKLRKITGSLLFPGATTAIIMWLKKNEVESLKKAKYILYCKDWVRFKLTGDIEMDFTDASTSLLDLSNGNVSDELFEILHIKEYTELIPELSQSCSLAGMITKEAEKSTGLKESTPVVNGMMDISAAAVGMGAVNGGDCCTLIGTTICNEVIRKDYISSTESTSGYEIHAVDNLYLNVIAPMAGTPNLDWTITNFFEKEKEEAVDKNIDLFKLLEKKLEDIPVGSNGIVYLPYINSSGERAPFYNPNASAQFFGLSENADKYSMLKAVYEGIALAIRDCLNDIDDLRKIYLGGGGAKSFYWARIVADCTGKEIIIPKGEEFAAKGAALCAGVYCGVFKDFKDAVEKTSEISITFKPNSDNKKIYDKLYKIYKQLRISNTEAWKLRKEII